MLSAGDHVRNLLGLYCEAVDAGDWEAVGALFVRGTLATADGTPLAAGAEQVAAFYRGATRSHEGAPRTAHVVADTVLSIEGESVIAARSRYVVYQAVEGVPLQPIITGRYQDRFAREGEAMESGALEAPNPKVPDPVVSDLERSAGWHFVERRFAVDLVGDLSHHLTFDPPAT